MKDPLTIERGCPHCRLRTIADIIRIVTASGGSQLRGRCRRCGQVDEAQHLPHSVLGDTPVASLTIDRDYRRKRCHLCGRYDAIFGHQCRPSQAGLPGLSEPTSSAWGQR